MFANVSPILYQARSMASLDIAVVRIWDISHPFYNHSKKSGPIED
jgi:hypothetical protein